MVGCYIIYCYAEHRHGRDFYSQYAKSEIDEFLPNLYFVLPNPGFGIKDKGPFRILWSEFSTLSGAGKNGMAKRPKVGTILKEWNVTNL